jgi:rubrerythrin
MDAHVAAGHLSSLMHLDIDAAEVYDEVLKHVTDEEIAASYRAFKGEHANHAKVLAEAITAMGETPPEQREDLMGRIAEMAMGIRSVTGDSGALHAMHTAEKLHNSQYAASQEWDVEASLKETLAAFYEDEKRHLAYIEKRLEASAIAG